MAEMNPKTKEALKNPDIPHIHFDNVIWEPIILDSPEMEEKGCLVDLVLVALKDNEAVATLRISGTQFAEMSKMHSLKNLQEFLN